MTSSLIRIARLAGLACSAAAALHAAPATPAAKDDRTRWFREARFGMFIHWGVYSVPAGEWQGKQIGGIGEWIMRNGKIPVADYRALVKDFSASDYDPAAWARLARTAGMKYVVITAKHHDGFALYDTAVSDWDAVNASGAARDLLTPLAQAVRAEGLKFGCYYSQAQDWTHPGGAKAGNSDWDPAHSGDFDAYLRDIALPQTKEILERFDPAILWWDTPVNMNAERAKPFAELLAAHPSIITNNRLGGGFQGDTKTPEQHIPPRGYPGELFEVCMTMNDTWGFKKNDHNWKSVRQLLRNLSDISSKGGNFLLNVGPDSKGRIPQESIERLQAMGRWMQVNAEAIHATEAGPFPRRLAWGRVTRRTAADGKVTLYAHVWEWPADGRILLPTMTQLPEAARMLATGETVRSEASPDGVVLLLPKAAPDPDVSVVRLEFDSDVTVTQQPYNTPGADGRIHFSAQDADAHGSYDGNIQLKDSGPNAYLTDWRNPRWRLEYALSSPTARTWKVSAEVASEKPVKLLLTVDKIETPAAVEATGTGLTWKTVELGEITLPKGEARFGVKGVVEGWSGASIRHVWLTPKEP